MSFVNHDRPARGWVVSQCSSLLLALAAFSASSAACALDTGDTGIVNGMLKKPGRK